LFNVDDGSASEAETLEMLRIAQDAGVKHILATPHATEAPSSELGKLFGLRLQETKRLAQKNGINIEISGASELLYCEQIVNWINEPWATFNGNGKYFLFELSLFELPDKLSNFIFETRLGGMHPILAHPERYLYLHNKKDFLYHLRDQGCLMQLNAGSINEQFGSSVKAFALKLLSEQFYHFCASDAHDTTHRSYRELTKAKTNMADICETSYISELFESNPLRAIEGGKVSQRELKISEMANDTWSRVKQLIAKPFQ
jgi:protein-tyrosine phosphatase